MSIKAIIFDLDDTLFDHKLALSKALNEFFHLHLELSKAYPDSLSFQFAWQNSSRIFYPKFLAGEITYNEQRMARIRALWAKAGLSVDDDRALFLSDEYLSIYEKHWELFPDTIACLDRMKPYKLGLITNGWSDQQRKKLLKCGILDRFDSIVISSEVDCAKPDTKIFQLACDQLKIKPSEAIFVGDVYDLDIAGAQSAGMQSIWLLRDNDIVVDSSLNIPRIQSLNELV